MTRRRRPPRAGADRPPASPAGPRPSAGGARGLRTCRWGSRSATCLREPLQSPGARLAARTVPLQPPAPPWPGETPPLCSAAGPGRGIGSAQGRIALRRGKAPARATAWPGRPARPLLRPRLGETPQKSSKMAAWAAAGAQGLGGPSRRRPGGACRAGMPAISGSAISSELAASRDAGPQASRPGPGSGCHWIELGTLGALCLGSLAVGWTDGRGEQPLRRPGGRSTEPATLGADGGGLPARMDLD